MRFIITGTPPDSNSVKRRAILADDPVQAGDRLSDEGWTVLEVEPAEEGS